ncbi:MAG: hypothetical protein Fur0025_03530 [Oscillatoriaceae cyanobacterium]
MGASAQLQTEIWAQAPNYKPKFGRKRPTTNQILGASAQLQTEIWAQAPNYKPKFGRKRPTTNLPELFLPYCKLVHV